MIYSSVLHDFAKRNISAKAGVQSTFPARDGLGLNHSSAYTIEDPIKSIVSGCHPYK